MNYKLGIYQAPEGGIVFDVDVEAETMWATQVQIAQLFGVDKEGERQVKREVKRYNLDVIISVGYRVNSMKATKFRVWSNRILKDYITKGIVVNQRQLGRTPEMEAEKKLDEIKTAMMIVERVIRGNELSSGEAKGVIEIISKYTRSFQVIDEYLKGKFILSNNRRARHELSGVEMENLVVDLKEKMGEGRGFGELRTEYDDFNNLAEEVKRDYSDDDSVSRKAAKLLYFIVKNKPFERGNQQIGGLLFVVYLAFNQIQLSSMGETKISDQALTALVLLISESVGTEKELLINLICKLLDN